MSFVAVGHLDAFYFSGAAWTTMWASMSISKVIVAHYDNRQCMCAAAGHHLHNRHDRVMHSRCRFGRTARCNKTSELQYVMSEVWRNVGNIDGECEQNLNGHGSHTVLCTKRRR